MYTIFIMLDRVITGLNCSTVYHIVALSALECVVNHIQHHAIPWPHSSAEVRYEILSKAETVVSVIFSPISKRNVLSGKESRELSFNVFLIATKPMPRPGLGSAPVIFLSPYSAETISNSYSDLNVHMMHNKCMRSIDVCSYRYVHAS